MPETLFKVDLTKPMDQQEMPGHNRWHPDIPAVASVNPDDVFRIECKDWTDGQIKDNDDPQDIADVNLEVVHVLSGPIWVNGAQPGDILVVDILEVGALQGDEWGFTGIFAKDLAVVSSPIISPKQPKPSGIWRVSTPHRATSPVCALRESRTQV